MASKTCLAGQSRPPARTTGACARAMGPPRLRPVRRAGSALRSPGWAPLIAGPPSSPPHRASSLHANRRTSHPSAPHPPATRPLSAPHPLAHATPLRTSPARPRDPPPHLTRSPTRPLSVPHPLAHATPLRTSTSGAHPGLRGASPGRRSGTPAGRSPWRARRRLRLALETVLLKHVLRATRIACTRSRRARPWGGARRKRGTRGAAPGTRPPASPGPRAFDRAGPRAFDRAGPRAFDRAGPRAFDRAAPRAQGATDRARSPSTTRARSPASYRPTSSRGPRSSRASPTPR